MNNIARRKALETDFEFSYRAKELGYRANVEKIWGKWDEAWQRAEHRKDFETGLLEVITYDGSDAGYLFICRYGDHLQLADIAILPEYRNKGIGTFLIKALLAEARSLGIPLGLGAFKLNHAAIKLYRSLGFVPVSENETHVRLLAR